MVLAFVGSARVSAPQHSSTCGHSSGWSGMARVVRDFDEEKVRDCKEDIDTLLVFVSATHRHL